MWKVKRMNTARIVVLAIAIGAGGIAAYLASGSSEAPPPAAPVAQLPTVDVLVAKNEIGLGQTVKPEDLLWQTWPAASASSAFIKRTDKPEAPKEFTGSIARSPFIAGEPIREQKLVKVDGSSGFMAAILPSGMRAVSTEITPETGAGGFILPNDRVDVILTQRFKNPEKPNLPDIVVSRPILMNIRVLAIDQAPKEKDGQTTAVGKTVTLELKPEQITTLQMARQGGSLSLALRSIVDAKAVETVEDDTARRGVNVNIIRFGVPSSNSALK
jgi:pilus assembly protein CpaB